jgi:CheY-like chemotaxis protein
VITDYDMPGMNGAEFARELRGLRDDVPVLLLTALPRVHQLHQNRVGLFDGVLGKPASTAQLAAAAVTAIDAARARSPACVS